MAENQKTVDLPVMSVADFRKTMLTPQFAATFPELKQEVEKYKSSNCGSCLGNSLRAISHSEEMLIRFKETFQSTIILDPALVGTEQEPKEAVKYQAPAKGIPGEQIMTTRLAMIRDIVGKELQTNRKQMEIAFPELKELFDKYEPGSGDGNKQLAGIFKELRKPKYAQRFNELFKDKVPPPVAPPPPAQFFVVVAKPEDLEAELRKRQFDPMQHTIDRLEVLYDGKLLVIVLPTPGAMPYVSPQNYGLSGAYPAPTMAGGRSR